MISNPFHLLSVFLSAIVAFYSWLFLISVLTKLFSIKNHRVRATLFVIPFAGLFLDFIAGQYSLSKWINPLSCKSCLQKYFLKSFYPQLNSYLFEYRISLVDYLEYNHGHPLISSIFFALVASSCILLGREFFRILNERRSMQKILRESGFCYRPVQNLSLSRELIRYRIQVYINPEIQVPFASYNHLIVIPKNVAEMLTQNEFESVIAHELEHIKHRDSLVRLLCNCLSAYFWWIPTHSVRKTMEQEQEMACDNKALDYGLNPESMASALVKVARSAKDCSALCYFATQGIFLKARVSKLLGIVAFENEQFFGFKLSCMLTGIFFIAACFAF